MNVAEIATATPAEIDTEIQRLSMGRQRLGLQLITLRRMLGQAENKETGYGSSYRGPSATELRKQIATAEREISDLIEAELPLGREFVRRGGWSRYFLVDDGHLHYDVSGDRCNRDFRTTHYWLTEFSGWDSDKVINGDGDSHRGAGERVCTKCFPDAPVNPRPAAARFMTLTEAERAAYAEEKARKAAAKKAAQITAPDGSKLRTAGGYRGDLIKTEVAARRRALQDAGNIAFYGTGHPSFGEWRETVDRMIAAIMHRDVTHFGGTGLTEEALRAEINGKVAKKARREGWTVKATI
jgi:hypothetical protein